MRPQATEQCRRRSLNPACRQVLRIARSVNGFLIPGGAQALHPGVPFFDTATLLFDLTVAANDKGEYLPVRCVCVFFSPPHGDA